MIKTLSHPNLVRSVKFSPDRSKILTGCQDHKARLWDASTGSLIRDFIGHTNTVRGAAFSPDGSRIATGSYDSTAKVWVY